MMPQLVTFYFINQVIFAFILLRIIFIILCCFNKSIIFWKFPKKPSAITTLIAVSLKGLENKSKRKKKCLLPDISDIFAILYPAFTLLLIPLFYLNTYLYGGNDNIDLSIVSHSRLLFIFFISCSNIYLLFMVGWNIYNNNKGNIFHLIDKMVKFFRDNKNMDGFYKYIFILLIIFLLIFLINMLGINIIINWIGITKSNIISYTFIRISLLPFMVYMNVIVISNIRNNFTKEKFIIDYSLFSKIMVESLTLNRLLLMTASIVTIFCGYSFINYILNKNNKNYLTNLEAIYINNINLSQLSINKWLHHSASTIEALYKSLLVYFSHSDYTLEALYKRLLVYYNHSGSSLEPLNKSLSLDSNKSVNKNMANMAKETDKSIPLNKSLSLDSNKSVNKYMANMAKETDKWIRFILGTFFSALIPKELFFYKPLDANTPPLNRRTPVDSLYECSPLIKIIPSSSLGMDRSTVSSDKSSFTRAPIRNNTSTNSSHNTNGQLIKGKKNDVVFLRECQYKLPLCIGPDKATPNESLIPLANSMDLSYKRDMMDQFLAEQVRMHSNLQIYSANVPYLPPLNEQGLDVVRNSNALNVSSELPYYSSDPSDDSSESSHDSSQLSFVPSEVFFSEYDLYENRFSKIFFKDLKEFFIQQNLDSKLMTRFTIMDPEPKFTDFYVKINNKMSSHKAMYIPYNEDVNHNKSLTLFKKLKSTRSSFVPHKTIEANPIPESLFFFKQKEKVDGKASDTYLPFNAEEYKFRKKNLNLYILAQGKYVAIPWFKSKELPVFIDSVLNNSFTGHNAGIISKALNLNIKNNMSKLDSVKAELTPLFYENAKALIHNYPWWGFEDPQSLIYINNLQINKSNAELKPNFNGFYYGKGNSNIGIVQDYRPYKGSHFFENRIKYNFQDIYILAYNRSVCIYPIHIYKETFWKKIDEVNRIEILKSRKTKAAKISESAKSTVKRKRVNEEESPVKTLEVIIEKIKSKKGSEVLEPGLLSIDKKYIDQYILDKEPDENLILQLENYLRYNDLSDLDADGETDSDYA